MPLGSLMNPMQLLVLRWLVGAALLAHVASQPVCRAKDAEFTHSTPARVSGGSRANGLRVDFSYEPLQHYGYQPVRFKVIAPKPAASDRSLTVRFYTDRSFNGSMDQYDFAMEQDADLPAGIGSVTIDLSVPKLHDWGLLRWEVWVDGVKDEELSAWAPQQNPGAEPPLDVLRPGRSGRAFPFGFDRLWRGRWGNSGGESVIEFSNDPLPEDWRTLCSYQAVVMSVDELKELSKQQPARLAVLNRWLQCGGGLIIEQVGDEYQRLAELDTLIGRDRQPFDRHLARELHERQRLDADRREGASEPQPTPPPYPESPAWDWANIGVPYDPFKPTAEVEPFNPGERRRTLVQAPGWFLESPFGFGTVLAFPAGFYDLPEKPLREASGTASRRNAMYAELDNRSLGRAVVWRLMEWRWPDRHGLEPDKGSPSFSDWMVPGVGAAPVDAFRWLITLFVLLVGPASFFVLRFYHRTQLLAILAPLAAAGFTLCLFAYATFSDGFGLRVRVRSVTFLDQNLGEAVSWSRQSYYAGLAPAEGLAFPPTAAVYPIMPTWEATDVYAGKPLMREIILTPEETRYSSGWLRSRETSQLLVVNAGGTDAHLVIDASGGELSVQNELGADIDALFVLDHEKNWWFVERLPAGAKQRLGQTDRPGFVAVVRRAFAEAAPAFPPGLDDGELRLGGDSTPYRLRRNRASRHSTMSLADSRLEKMMGLLEGRDDGLTAPLKPGSFLAITSRAAASPVGHADAREEGSFHVTLGVWGGP